MKYEMRSVALTGSASVASLASVGFASASVAAEPLERAERRGAVEAAGAAYGEI